MTILQAVQEVANNKFIHESIRKKYQNINLDIQMGVSIADAFRHFAENTNNQDAWDVAERSRRERSRCDYEYI